MKKAMFIGRWQPLHKGHMWLVDQKLKKDIPVLIAVRDIPPDEKNPFTTEQTVDMLKKSYADFNVEVMIIPDIESVNYGRGVGYEINEHVPPADVEVISATDIRNKIRADDESWKEIVSDKIHGEVVQYMKDNNFL